jgi:WD40 repeat protein/DNA-binding SARP family transcriptional activator/energy-coupling factor transporter ATP-binding protein EcfA2
MTRAAVAVGTEIRVLGPIELWRDGEPQHVGGPRQRTLLALLALRANQVIPAERLLEELFGRDAAEKSANAVQAAVSRLRRLLEPGALETRGRGYVLHLDVAQLDSALFERLLAEGRAQLAGGDAATAATTLGEALSLWRGAPLGDLAAPESVMADARRLGELRVIGLMDRVEAELELGAAQQLIPELELLVAEHPLQERLRGQLMLALYRCGRQADALTVYRETRQLLLEELGLEPSRALQELERAILRQDTELEPAAAAAEPVVLCPFKGLASFTTGDVAYYFGRERMVDEVVARLVDQPFVGLVGSSGSGKSSLLQAGVLAALAAGALPGSTAWRRAIVRPGPHPLAVLPDAVELLAVDQLEEAFTHCRDDDEREAFFAELVRRARGGTVVLLALRADYYGRCAVYPEFAALLSMNHVLLGAMRRDELANAIEGPAERAGLQAERELVDLVVGDVAGEPGALPLLSTTLVELWRRRTGRVLTAASYRESGGIRGAVARLAERAFAQLNEAEQGAARAVMLRLADEEDGAIVRRRVPIEELDTAADDDVARAVGVLTEARLLTVAEGTVEVSHETLLTEWPRLRGWLDEDRVGRRLRTHLAASAREWDERGRETGDLYRGPRLAAALDWSTDHGAELNTLEHAFLEASRRQSEVETERQQRQNRRLRLALVGSGVLLVAALVAGALALVQRGQARQAATAALAESVGAQGVSESRIDLAMLLARASVALDPTTRTRSDLLTTLLRVPAALRVYYWNANRNSAVAISPDGTTLAIEDNDGHTVVEQAATGRRIGAVNAVLLGFGPDGSLLTLPGGAVEDTIEVRDARNPSLTVKRAIALPQSFRGQDVSVGSLSVAGGRLAVLVTHSHDLGGGPIPYRVGVAQYDYASGRLVAPVTRLPNSVSGSSYVDGDRRLIYSDVNTTAVIDARTGNLIRRYPVGGDALAVSPDGRRAALASGDAIRFIDLATGDVALGIGAVPGGAGGIGFTPDGKTLVTSGNDGTTLLWDVASHSVRGTLTGHAGPIHAQAIASDGSKLYTGSFDANVIGWDLTGSRSFPASFQAIKTNPIMAYWTLAVSPDSRVLAIGSTTGRVALCTTRTLRRIRTFQAVPTGVSAVAFGDAGRELLVSGTTPTRSLLRIWRLGNNPAVVRTITVRGFVFWAAWSPDGRTIAAATRLIGQDQQRSGTVVEWNAATGRRIGTSVIKGGAPTDVTFASHGSEVAIGAINAGAEILDPAHGTVERKLPVGGLHTETLGVAFSPDGTKLATTDWEGTLDIWDVATGRRLARIPDPDQAVTASVAWSPDGTTIAVTDWENTLRLFDVATRGEIGPPFQLGPVGGNDNPYGVFTPDGKDVVVSDDTGRTWVVPVTLGAWEAAACRIADRNFTQGEWKNFFPGRPYRRVCA